MTDTLAAKRVRWSVAPYFIVDDVVATANFYRDQLGFSYERFWNEPSSFCMVHRNCIVIMLRSSNGRAGCGQTDSSIPKGKPGMLTSGSTMPMHSTPSTGRRA